MIDYTVEYKSYRKLRFHDRNCGRGNHTTCL